MEKLLFIFVSRRTAIIVLLIHAISNCAAAVQPVIDSSSLTPQDQLRKVQREYSDQIRPVLKESCGDCHWGDNNDAGLNLEPFESIDQLLAARKTWKKVLTRVAAKEMPPEDAAALSDTQHRDVLDWIDQLLNSVDCTDINPGRVTIRRLNRTEYRNTIRDLVGVDYYPADGFPGDDVGYGFDNIADVLSLPPSLFEQYLDAAETIAQEAIVAPGKPRFRKLIQGTDFAEVEGTHHVDGAHGLFSDSTISHVLNVPETGLYEFAIRVAADQAGDEPAKLVVSVDGSLVSELEIGKFDGRKFDSRDGIQNPVTRRFRTRLEQGKQPLEVKFPNDLYVERTAESGKQDRNVYVLNIKLTGPIPQASEFQREFFGKALAPDPAKFEPLVKKSLQRLMTLAWRRPLRDGELQRMLQLYQQAIGEGDSPTFALRRCLQATLISPWFLFKIESPSLVANGASETQTATNDQLTDYELATRLSYFLWSTMPDAELFGLAEQKKLRQPAILKQQARRMLQHEKSRAVVDNFAAQWLQLSSVNSIQPDPESFPGITKLLKKDMRRETLLLVDHIVRNDESIFRFLDADYSFINSRLARHYGIDHFEGNVGNNEFLKVKTSQVGRFGVLTHASILAITSNPTRTSPVKRGKWIMENLLGEEPPPPDPAAIALEDQQQLTGTMRERMVQHREDPNCAVCHLVMDELGFALEHFDGVGRWRDMEEGAPVDASGELPDGTTFDGAEELQQLLSTQMRDQFVRCLTEKMLIYALGRGLEYFDECTVDDILTQLAANDYRFSELVLAVVTSEPFCLIPSDETKSLPQN